MRSVFVIFLICIMAANTSAQSQKQLKVDSVFVLVKKYFNLKNADAIYNLTGNGFQKELSIDTFNTVANQRLFVLGKITQSSLISFVNNNLATYKVKLGANTLLQVAISLDTHYKVETLLFQPYKDPISNKTALVPTSNTLRTEMDKKVDTVARQYIQKANTVGLCIGIIKDGQVTTYGYGDTKKGNGKIPNADNFFEIGSITKTFTATLLAYFADKGDVKLTDPITKYLPDSVSSNQALQKITLLMLCNHTSGLANLPDNLKDNMTDAFNPYKNYNKPLLYSYLKTCKLNSKPGEQYAYSNLGVGLLGTILQYISGQTFERMVNEVICKPLGMLSTGQYLNPLNSQRFVSVYNAVGDITYAWDFDVLAPSGSLRSTMNDMLLYTKANMQAGTDSLSKAMQLTHKPTYTKDVKIGMAWHIIVVNGINYYFHNGGTYGSNCFLAFNPEKNTAVIVLSNAFESTDAVGTGILKKIQ